MHVEEIGEQLGRPLTRRRVVTTGAKLAYAAPLVAATFKLTGGGVAAAPVCVCPAFKGIFPVVSDPSVPSLGGAPGCCHCGCTVGVFTYNPVTDVCDPVDPLDQCTPTCEPCTQIVTLP